jgi:hypothetical protein
MYGGAPGQQAQAFQAYGSDVAQLGRHPAGWAPHRLAQDLRGDQVPLAAQILGEAAQRVQAVGGARLGHEGAAAGLL